MVETIDFSLMYVVCFFIFQFPISPALVSHFDTFSHFHYDGGGPHDDTSYRNCTTFMCTGERDGEKNRLNEKKVEKKLKMISFFMLPRLSVLACIACLNSAENYSLSFYLINYLQGKSSATS